MIIRMTTEIHNLTFEFEFDVTAGCSPWRGSVESCPSAADWYGTAPEFDGLRSCRVYDDEGHDRVPTEQETALLIAWIQGPGAEQVAQHAYDQQVELEADAREDALERAAEAHWDRLQERDR